MKETIMNAECSKETGNPTDFDAGDCRKDIANAAANSDAGDCRKDTANAAADSGTEVYRANAANTANAAADFGTKDCRTNTANAAADFSTKDCRTNTANAAADFSTKDCRTNTANAAAAEKDSPEAFLHELLFMGELMQASGAEVLRVEDTLNRMGRAYGIKKMNVLVITASIIITIELPDGREMTQTRRIRDAGGNDFTRLERLNKVSRVYCAAPFLAGELHQKLVEIYKSRPGRLSRWLGSLLIAFSFTVFFGGTPADALVAAGFAALICLMQEHLRQYCSNQMVFNVAASFVTGLGISLAAHWLIWLNAAMVMSGDIMLLIPGVALTNAVRDVLMGDTISGIMRFVEAVLWSVCLAFGFMCAIWLTQKIWYG